MLTNRQIFFNHIAQTSAAPMALEITEANGIEMTDANGKKYLDLISGISVSNAGHANSKVIDAVYEQMKKFSHLMVYGEFIQHPQTVLAKYLVDHLPSKLNSVYFTNSGSEAVEGAMKLVKRYTSRSEIISCNHAYHGSTQGALSLMGDEHFKSSFRPLLPGNTQIRFNNEIDLEKITNRTAAVFIEPIQGEAGVVLPNKNYLQQLSVRCHETKTLLVFDEIQTGGGRTGKRFAFEKFNVIPDVLLLAKSLGGGLPLGAFITSKEIMSSLSHDPVLGHITTFGGNAVCCAAGLAAMKIIDEQYLIEQVEEKENLFRKLLVHPKIKSVRSCGLLMAIEFESAEINFKIIESAIQQGVLTDWFLFAPHSMRIAPPLIISNAEIEKACNVILKAIDQI